MSPAGEEALKRLKAMPSSAEILGRSAENRGDTMTSLRSDSSTLRWTPRWPAPPASLSCVEPARFKPVAFFLARQEDNEIQALEQNFSQMRSIESTRFLNRCACGLRRQFVEVAAVNQ